jgi:hypothetical protein
MGKSALWLLVGVAATACGGMSVTNVYENGDAACAVPADAATATLDATPATDANAPDADAADTSVPDAASDAAADVAAADVAADVAPDVIEAGVIPIGQPCTTDYDCVSSACDSVSLTCVASQCNDHRVDGAETDVDCGGPACPVCATGKVCKVDNDCSTFACDVFNHVCITNSCQDHTKDYAETDIDCGGGTCPACALGKGCWSPSDCASTVCDTLTRKCIESQCADHVQDGAETDIDCGGNGGCPACNVGQKCLTNFDCISGHFCNGIKVCQ